MKKVHLHIKLHLAVKFCRCNLNLIIREQTVCVMFIISRHFIVLGEAKSIEKIMHKYNYAQLVHTTPLKT